MLTKQKICSKCKQLLDRNQFYLRQNGWASGMCKRCIAIEQKEYRRKNPEKIKERGLNYAKSGGKSAADKRYRESHKEELKIKKHNYFQNNKDLIYEKRNNNLQKKEYDKEYKAKHYQENRDDYLQRSKLWRIQNRFWYNLLSSNYRSRKLNAPGTCTEQQLQWRWEMYGGLCWVCGDIATAIDHVKPLSKGGNNWPGNLKPICQSCNSRKRNRWPFSAQAI